MRYILMTYVGPEHLDAWNGMTTEERQGDVDRTMAWFRENASRIVGGEELGYPRKARTVRGSGITDGPFIETKELLGGFVVLEVPDEATALKIAEAWPGLAWPGDAVEVRPVGDSHVEVNT